MNALRIATCLIVLVSLFVVPEQPVLADPEPPRLESTPTDLIPHQCTVVNLPYHNFMPIIFGDGSGVPLDGEPPRITDIKIGPLLAKFFGVVTATIDDSLTGNSNIASADYQLDGGAWLAMEAQDCDFSDQVVEPVIAFLPAYPVPGLHTVCVRGTDTAGNRSQPVCTEFAVYDPSAGFVTGGGWFQLNGTGKQNLITPKVTFGFVAKYLPDKLEPQGSLEFHIKNETFNFHASKFDWLVVDPQQGSAILHGEGMLNGAATYQFQLWVTDNHPDTMQIKIWKVNSSGETVVFDNQFDQPLEGGGIVLHSNNR